MRGSKAPHSSQRDVRSSGNEGESRRRTEIGEKLRSIDRRDITVELGVGYVEVAPFRVLELILGNRAADYPAVAIESIHHELLPGSLHRQLRFPGDPSAHAVPAPIALPAIFDKSSVVELAAMFIDLMRHRMRDVMLIEQKPRRRGDKRRRNDLLDEDHPATPARPLTNIETEVDLLVGLMEWIGNAEELGIEEHQADKAEECLSIIEIELGLEGEVGEEEIGRDLIVEEEKVSPGSVERVRQFHSTIQR